MKVTILPTRKKQENCEWLCEAFFNVEVLTARVLTHDTVSSVREEKWNELNLLTNITRVS